MSQAYKTFSEWYENRNNISPGVRHTVEVILQQPWVKTDNLEALTNLRSLKL